MKRSSSWNSNRMFLLNILLPVALTLLLFIVSLYQIVIPRFEEIVLDRKREMIRELTRSAWHIADRFHQEAAQGLITREEAQRRTIDQIRHLRYGDERKDYFWITDYRPAMIMHPFRDDLNGSDLADFRDSRGKKLFVEMATIARARGAGYVDYTWQWKDDSTRIVPKLSYVEAFPPWEWIIGTGIYLEDVRAEIAELERNVVRISILITAAIVLLLFFIAMQNLRSERRRLRAEQDMREAKDKYEALVEAATEGLLMVLDGDQVVANRTLLFMLGYTEEEADAVALLDVFPEDIRAKLRDAGGRDAWIAAGNAHCETHVRKSDGSLLEVLLIASPITLSDQHGVIVIIRDISHHKEMALALDETKEKFHALTNQLSMAVFRTDAGTMMHVIEANAATARMFGFATASDMHGASFGDFFTDPGIFAQIRRELQEAGSVKNRITHLKRKDGSAVELSLSLALVTDDAGASRYCDCIAEEISEYMRYGKDAHALLGELQMPLAFLHEPVHPFIRDCAALSMDATVAQASAVMARLRARMLFVADATGRYIGIITRDDANAAGEGGGRRVYEAMRAPLVHLRHTASVYDALALHFESGAHVLVVKDDAGTYRGSIDINDVLEKQLRSYLFLLARLRQAGSVAELRHCNDALRAYIRMVIGHGASAETVARSVAVVSDALVRRLIALAMEELGPAPARFVFLALGSEGRCEQTLVTDQDNALLYEDGSDEHASTSRDYFTRLGEWVCDALDVVGYAYCKGNVMAKNPTWCQPLSQWKQYVSGWVTTANPQDLLDVSIFFDFRTVFGDESLTEQLRAHLVRVSAGNNSFLVYLALNALRVKPPTGQVKAQEPFDSKLALLPIIDLARIYSLKHSVHSTNTLERLAQLHERGVFTASGYRDIVQVYHYLMSLRYRHQAGQCARNAPPNNIIPTASLSEFERHSVRRVLALIEDFQTKLSLDFKGAL